MTILKICDLAIGDRVSVTWHPGQTPLVGTVTHVMPNASKASGTHIKTDAGQTVQIKASMRIVRA
jgi:hypothetical protein